MDLLLESMVCNVRLLVGLGATHISLKLWRKLERCWFNGREIYTFLRKETKYLLSFTPHRTAKMSLGPLPRPEVLSHGPGFCADNVTYSIKCRSVRFPGRKHCLTGQESVQMMSHTPSSVARSASPAGSTV
ncbi:hypothetical protein RRG08_019197 [Elysia crispata]|uniref:Uncharacterized protein n=1 Tax=Elysia crispata TaxID=231223 RepID=A0AAE1ATR0_9GAST|nr:hypothetical protein RRG08_019197 [Elysia crispata]